MALTPHAKVELAALPLETHQQKRAELATILRFTNALHLLGGKIVIESEVDSEHVARRMRHIIATVFGHSSELTIISGGLRHGSRYIVRVFEGGATLARQTGLLDARGRPVRGLPPIVVNGSKADAASIIRGAFLAHGSLTEPGRSAAIEFTCPSTEAALALVGAARRLNMVAKAREVRGVDRVTVRDGDTIELMLFTMGAHNTLNAWRQKRTYRDERATANRLANFDNANLRRSTQAAVTAGLRVERALQILGDQAPEHLRAAGMLRVQYRQMSLDELGQMAQPPLSKDAIAGRIRRLLLLADQRAEQLGIPGTMPEGLG
ncbi:MAG: DNA-binding protein WhiA [Rothia sp. (in: high G+C Gram-positive bacteria)]|uniref:DNA-binding protein WhiA n=1 Tax=Rothia sp. (in: high G+C Gram-positive bacteria) TaxID=1885016 RepID=UPI0026DFC331|nr:DNA-binding protein WhiA [Rothia sp. (in: high G+C Gram-positive bacteria)]MDO5750739.1 DNA-binding protein WhiA [Rothia sp. (in: high G+C Gram-positive bacteria)]